MHSLLNVPSKLIQLLDSISDIKQIKKGNYLYEEGKEATKFYKLKSGKVALSKITIDGREITIQLTSSGDFFGELSLFSPTSVYRLNARIIENGEVAVINKEELEKELSKDKNLLIEFLKWINLLNQDMQIKLQDMMLHGRKGALYSTLIRLSNSYGQKTKDGIRLELRLTNQELANFCGTSREVVNRMLSKLKKNRVISVDNGLIVIQNLKYLKANIECENCPVSICTIN